MTTWIVCARNPRNTCARSGRSTIITNTWTTMNWTSCTTSRRGVKFATIDVWKSNPNSESSRAKTRRRTRLNFWTIWRAMWKRRANGWKRRRLRNWKIASFITILTPRYVVRNFGDLNTRDDRRVLLHNFSDTIGDKTRVRRSRADRARRRFLRHCDHNARFYQRRER